MLNIAKNNDKVLSTKYYKKRLWKITCSAHHLVNGSVYKDSRNRYVKIYNKRDKVGGEWMFVSAVTETGVRV